MTFRIVVVCSANVCRSPVASAILRSALADAGMGQVHVSSFGESAMPGAPACAQMLARAAATGLIGPEDLADHRSRQLVGPALADADLVLATDRSVRAGVIRLEPTAHAYTFTLRQAVELGSRAVGSTPGLRAKDAVGALHSFTERLGDWRGMTDVPEIEGHRLPNRPWKRVRVHSHDIPDAHKGTHLHPLASHLLIGAAQDLGRLLTSTAQGISRS